MRNKTMTEYNSIIVTVDMVAVASGTPWLRESSSCGTFVVDLEMKLLICFLVSMDYES